MKKFFITLGVSAVVIAGIWVVPNALDSNQQAERSVASQEAPVYEYPREESLELDSVTPPAAREKSQEYLEQPQLQEIPVTASKPATDWQALITWIIGSLNGVFGLAVMVKKVFGKHD